MSWNSENTNTMVTIDVCGKHYVELPASQVTTGKIMSLTKDVNVKNFKVFVNGDEISEPEDFAVEPGDNVRLTVYDKAG